ncbi:hypothetical protein CA2015_3562 [Cyclobacterium amurskyense]|uniref:Uncharacterized protein n=1 Tax=Cyclobacterium amurskyense TaxID=320787 RepID=A0A0H4PX49_9BACT|nr:hypothetical protein CA2015_3562 [Cyclobacterium amurskyense]
MATTHMATVAFCKVIFFFILFFGLWLKDVLIKPIKFIFHKEIIIFIVNWLLFPVNGHIYLVNSMCEDCNEKKIRNLWYRD